MCAQETRGPLDTHSPTIFQLSSGDFIPVIPLSLKEDESEFRLMSNWSNTFTVSEHMVDHEILHMRPSIWYGITDNFSLGVMIPINVVGGGYMDSLIDNFHEAIGIVNDRNNHPRNLFTVTNQHGTSNYSTYVMLGDIMLNAQYKLLDNVIIGMQLQVPTSTRTDWFKRSGVGVGVSLLMFHDIGDFRIFAAGNYALIGKSEIAGQELQSDQAILLWGVDFKVSDRLSLVAQWINMSGNTDFDRYNQWSTEVAIGGRYRFSNYVSAEVAFTENLFKYRNSADFGIHCGLIFKLRE